MYRLFFLQSFAQILFGDPYITAITENDPSTFVDDVILSRSTGINVICCPQNNPMGKILLRD